MSLFTQFYPSAGKTQNSLFESDVILIQITRKYFKIFPLSYPFCWDYRDTQKLSTQLVNFVAIKISGLDEIILLTGQSRAGLVISLLGRESRNLCDMG